MKRERGSAWCIGALLLVLAGCGGGGGGGGGGSTGPSSTPAGGANTSVTIESNAITITTTPTDVQPVRTLVLTVNNMPADGLYVDGEYSENGLALADVFGTSDTTGQLLVQFKRAADLPDGVYEDVIEFKLCHDEACNSQVIGSPVKVTTKYTVASPASATIDQTSISLIQTTSASFNQPQSLTLTIAGLPADAPALTIKPTQGSYNGVSSVSPTPVTATQTRVDVNFHAPNTKPPGVYTDTLNLAVCYDSACKRPVQGAPFAISTSYTLVQGQLPEPGIASVPISSRVALGHDVVDAEFSKSLNALVMVSSWPQNVLRVRDEATGSEKTLALNKPPRAVSLSPDGSKAAIGHDALITYVDLTQLGAVGAPAPKLLNLSAVAGDLVLDGRGKVHVFPAVDQWINVHTVDVATNTETKVWTFTYAGSRARLHPAGDKVYSANNGLSPSDIQAYDVSVSPLVSLGDSPYHGDYAMCGNLWFSEDGATIYTACGNAFRSSTVAGQDMVYAGAMVLGGTIPIYYWYEIQSLSHRGAAKEIAVIDQSTYECRDFTGQAKCYSHLNLYDSDFLNRTAQFVFPTVQVNGLNYQQLGRFVFHRNGGAKVVISELLNVPDRAQQFHLSVVP